MNTMNPSEFTLSQAVEKYRSGDIDGAQTLFLNLLNTDPKNPDALYFMGIIDHSAGRFEVAEHRAEELLQVKQNDGRALNLMGTILMSQRKTGEALPYFERGLKHAKDDPTLKVNAAICHIGEGEPQKSIQLCKDAIGLDENQINAYNILGNAYLATGQLGDAVNTFSRALKIFPQFHDALFNKGVALYDLNRYDEALECFESFLQNQPDSPHGLCRKADVLVIRNQLPEAGELYEKAISVNENFTPGYVGRGKIFQRLKQFDGALDNFSYAIKLDPNNIEALMNAGDTFRRMGNMEAAAAAFSDVLAIDPENAQAKFHLASVDGSEAPAKPDGDYVKRLFDEFVPTYDQNLKKIEYAAPSKLYEVAIQHIEDSPVHKIIDLGCGTGLSGERFKSLASHIKGVDISPNMVEAASKKAVYDELEVNDLLETLVRHQDDTDIIICADTFPYLGDLESPFLAIHSALKEGGLLLFSTEAHDGEESFILGQTTRYRHSQAYIESLADRRGFDVLTLDRTSYRKEGGDDVPGFIVALRKSA